MLCRSLPLAALVAVAVSGCALYSFDRPVRISVPAPPDAWTEAFGPLSFVVTWPVSAGKLERQLFDPGSTRVERLPKRATVPVLAYPLLGTRTTSLLPAGALFPESLGDDGTLKLRWADGHAAAILTKLIGAGENDSGGAVSRLNSARLAEEMWKRSDGNPWKLDGAAIIRGLEAGAFRATIIRRKESYPAALTDIGSVLVSANPLDPSYTPDALGTVALSLTAGAHRFFSADGSTTVDVTMDTDGRFVTLIRPLCLRACPEQQ